MNTAFLNQMRDAVTNGSAKILTLEAAKNLKGKKIRTIYFGYHGQDGVDEFVVGNIIEKDWIPTYEPKIKMLLREDGSETHISMHYLLGYDFFSCSDADRNVYFIEL